MTPPVLIVCARCAGRYGGVVDPACPICDGRGTLGVAVPEGVQPAVAVRAAGMLLGAATTFGWGCGATDEKIKRLRASALHASSSDAVGLADKSQPSADPAAIGRAAGKLLDEMALRQRRPRKPPKKRRTKAEIDAEKRARHVMIEAMNRQQEEFRRKREQRDIERAAQARVAEAYRQAHPDEFAEVMESELAFAEVEQFAKDTPFQITVPGMV